MAQVINIRNVGQYGVISDPNPCDIPGNAFSDALNVRFKGSAAEKFGGHAPTLTKSQPSGEEFNAIVGLDEQTWNYKGWIVGAKSKIYRVDESNWTDVSRDGAAYLETSEPWLITRLSNSIVMNRKTDVPQGLTPTALKFVNLPRWGIYTTVDPADPKKRVDVQEYWRANVMRSYKNFLIGLNMLEGSDEANAIHYSQRVRWSDAAENGQLPASWDDASPEGFASYNDLGNAEGGIVDAAQLRDSMIIYTNKEVHAMTWIGGSQLFSFRRLFSDTGLIAPGCVVEFESQHFVIGSNDIFVHDGATKRSVIYGRIERKLMSEIRGVNPWATRAFSNPAKKEVWVCYVVNGTPNIGGETATWFDRAAVWNWQDDTWTFYDLPSIRALALAPTPDPDSRNWEEQPGEWDEQVEPWNLYDDNFINESILGASQFNEIFMLDSGDKVYYPEYSDTVTMKQAQMVAYMERVGLDLDQEGAKIYEEKELFKVWPQVSGSGELKVEVGGQTSINKPVYLEQAQFYNIEEDYVAEFRVAYRYLAFRFESQKPGAWKFSGYDYEILVGTAR